MFEHLIPRSTFHSEAVPRHLCSHLWPVEALDVCSDDLRRPMMVDGPGVEVDHLEEISEAVEEVEVHPKDPMPLSDL